MVRINRVYTKTGDQGQTSLIGGERTSKASPRIECYGTVDELNATLGLVVTAMEGAASAAELLPIFQRVQNELFNLGAELSTPDAARVAKAPHIEERHVAALEKEIDKLNEGLPDLKSFVLPGGGAVSAHCHLARTVCRRAERLVVALAATETVRPEAIRYLNRLSDALFVFGRYASQRDGHPEPLWDSRKT
jgi:cob(I)alamin adenosyltransferase